MNKRFALFLLTTLLLQACVGLRVDSPVSRPADELPAPPLSTAEPVQPAKLQPTPIQILPSPTATPVINVTFTASGGNLFIRRGPDIRFNQIGVLYKGQSAQVLARDVLLEWAQIQIPDSDKIGWVSTQTKYAMMDGDFSALPEISPTEFPLPATVRNCTFHKVVILPGRYILNSAYFSPDNELWLPPGNYAAYDVDAPDEPEVLSFDIREGQSIDVIENGLGEKHKCH